MTDLRKAAELALEALEEYCITRTITRPIASSDALRQALAQEQTKCSRCGEANPAEIHTCSPQVAQEPVAWEKSYDIVCSLLRQAHDILATTQYPIKRPWVGLRWEDMPETYAGDWSFLQGAKWAEAKLKEKNGG